MTKPTLTCFDFNQRYSLLKMDWKLYQHRLPSYFSKAPWSQAVQAVVWFPFEADPSAFFHVADLQNKPYLLVEQSTFMVSLVICLELFGDKEQKEFSDVLDAIRFQLELQ